MGKTRFTLLIGDRGVCLTGAGPPLWAMNGDPAAMQGVRTHLNAQPQAPVTLLVDSGAQDYRLETLPRLSALDRRQLLRRRLLQAFPARALVASQSRQDGQVLLAGVADSGSLALWREFLRDRSCAVCLLPVEGVAVLQRLRPAARSGWWLLLAPLATGGLRQIVSRDGQLVFTRLTPPPGGLAPAEMAAAMTGDIRASLGYLARLGLTDSRQLDALLLVPPDWSAACAASDLPLRSLAGIAPARAAAQLGLPPTVLAPEGWTDGLFAAAQGKPALRLSPVASAAPSTVLALGDWSLRAAWGALALALLLVLWPAVQLAQTAWQNHQAAARLTTLQHDLAEQQAAAAPMTEPLGRLRGALERQTLFAGDALPWPVVPALAQALGTDTKLVRLDWVAGGNSASEEWQLAAQWRPAPVTPPASPVPADAAAATATPEAAVARFRQLARDIAAALPDYAVDLTHLPYPALPQEVVSNTHDAPATDDTALLTLRRAP